MNSMKYLLCISTLITATNAFGMFGFGRHLIADKLPRHQRYYPDGKVSPEKPTPTPTIQPEKKLKPRSLVYPPTIEPAEKNPLLQHGAGSSMMSALIRTSLPEHQRSYKKDFKAMSYIKHLDIAQKIEPHNKRNIKKPTPKNSRPLNIKIISNPNLHKSV